MENVITTPAGQKATGATRFLGNTVSVLFHPLLIGAYIAAYFIFGHPDYFIGVSHQGKMQTFLIYLVNAVFFPLLSVSLCRALGFIQSFFYQTRQERIILYSITMIFFFWTFYVFKNKAGVPAIMTQMSLGLFLSVIAAFLANIYFRVSMHAVGAGGMLGIFVVLLFTTGEMVHLPLILSVLIAGITCTARLLVSDHSAREIAWGFCLGFLCQWIAYWVL